MTGPPDANRRPGGVRPAGSNAVEGVGVDTESTRWVRARDDARAAQFVALVEATFLDRDPFRCRCERCW